MYEDALEILNILENNNYESYIVGGFVRDKLLGIDSYDIDIITSATPTELCNIFNIQDNSSYGSIKLQYKNNSYDVTTFRKEINYIDNRWPIIEYIKDVKEDLNRRDFTINAILIDKNGNYKDLVGGINDLNNKVLKVIGDANKKIRDDSLRILRALRFSSIYNLSLDSDLKEAIMNNKSLISNLSFDRIKRELDIVFSSLNVNLFLDMINYYDLFKLLKIEPINSVKIADNYLLIWSQINYSNKYNFSKKEKTYIDNIKDILKNGITNYTIYKYGKELNKDANKILKLNIDIDYIYDNLIIKKRSDIDITYEEILKIINDKSIINEIYIDLEKHLLYNKLINKKDSIISYLEGDRN